MAELKEARTDGERFLFTGLPEAERQRLEEQILFDDDLFEEVLAAEDDLLDAAVRGELDPAAEERLAHLPELEQRLDFARQLARSSTRHRVAGEQRTPLRRVAPWLAVAAMVWLSVGFGWLWLTLNSNTSAEFVLRPTGLRGGGPELTVGQGVEQIMVHLELTQSPKENHFAVVLATKEGAEVKRWERLTSKSFAWGTAVVVQLATVELGTGSYSAHLLEIDPEGAGKEAGIYSFKVTLTN